MIKDSKPLHSCLVRLDTAYQEEILLDSGLKLYLDPTYNKSWNATVTGKIAALPIRGKNKNENAILKELKIGDEICMSYRVVADFQFASDGKQFMSTLEDNPYMQYYINGEGEKVQVSALPTKDRKIIWVGAYLDKYNQFIHGCQGTESEVLRWKSQFSFGKTDNYTFNNLFNFNGIDYWKCDLKEIYAKNKKGRVYAVGEKVICKPVEEVVPSEVAEALGYKEEIKIRRQDRAEVLSGGKNKGIKVGQIISFDQKVLEKYVFFGKEFYIVNSNRINGIWR